MTARQPPTWADDKAGGGPDYPADVLRGIQYVSFSGRTGVLPQVGGDSCRVAAGTGAQVTVAPGAVLMPDGAGGAWLGQIVAQITVNLSAAEAQPRIDLVVATEAAGGTWSVTSVKGTAAASPVPPSLPARSTLLAQVTVPSAGAIVVADARVWTAASGGVLRVPTEAALPSGTVPGLLAYIEASKTWKGSDGTATWKPIAGVPAGGGVWDVLAKKSAADFDAGWRTIQIGTTASVPASLPDGAIYLAY